MADKNIFGGRRLLVVEDDYLIVMDLVQRLEASGAEVIGVSVDSPHSHVAWLNMPKDKGGINGVKYTLVSDLNKAISRAYDVCLPEGVALRATFIIDKAGIVQSELVNNLPIGRSVDEVLRVLQAVQFVEKHGEVCPANWKEGSKTMQATREGVQKFFGG